MQHGKDSTVTATLCSVYLQGVTREQSIAVFVRWQMIERYALTSRSMPVTLSVRLVSCTAAAVTELMLLMVTL